MERARDARANEGEGGVEGRSDHERGEEGEWVWRGEGREKREAKDWGGG